MTAVAAANAGQRPQVTYAISWKSLKHLRSHVQSNPTVTYWDLLKSNASLPLATGKEKTIRDSALTLPVNILARILMFMLLLNKKTLVTKTGSNGKSVLRAIPRSKRCSFPAVHQHFMYHPLTDFGDAAVGKLVHTEIFTKESLPDDDDPAWRYTNQAFPISGHDNVTTTNGFFRTLQNTYKRFENDWQQQSSSTNVNDFVLFQHNDRTKGEHEAPESLWLHTPGVAQGELYFHESAS